MLATGAAGWLIVAKLPADGEPSAPPASAAAARPIGYRQFGDLAGLTLTGSARQEGNRLRLTAGAGQTGAVWSAYPLVGSRSLSAAFRFAATGSSGTLGFVLTPDRAAKPRITVDLEWTIPAANQVTISAIRLDGTRLDLGDAAARWDLGAGPVTVWVDYLARERVVRVYAAATLTKPAAPIVTTALDLPALLGTTTIYAGFTASTDDKAGTQDLLAWHTAAGA